MVRAMMSFARSRARSGVTKCASPLMAVPISYMLCADRSFLSRLVVSMSTSVSGPEAASLARGGEVDAAGGVRLPNDCAAARYPILLCTNLFDAITSTMLNAAHPMSYPSI